MEDPLTKSKRRQRIEKKFENSKTQEQQCKGQVGGLVPQVRSSPEFFFSFHLISSLGLLLILTWYILKSFAVMYLLFPIWFIVGNKYLLLSHLQDLLSVNCINRKEWKLDMLLLIGSICVNDVHSASVQASILKLDHLAWPLVMITVLWTIATRCRLYNTFIVIRK